MVYPTTIHCTAMIPMTTNECIMVDRTFFERTMPP